MVATNIPWGHPSAVNRFAASLAVEHLKMAYFGTRFVGKGENNVVEEKKELESEAGDRVSFDLSVTLKKKPTTGDQRLEGNGEDLKFFSDEIIIDQCRHEVSAGGRMTQKRTVHNLRTVARNRMSEYWTQWTDELMFMYLSGARGMNEDFIEDTDYAGHAGNPLRAPDAQHLIFGGSATSKATLTAADTMTRNLIEKTLTKARMLRARDKNAANMVPVRTGNAQRFVFLMSAYQEHDLRTESGASGWLEIQKSAAGAEGKDNPIFKGGLGMLGNCVLHSHESAIRFNDYGAGADVEASRALLMGRQAGVCAYGYKQRGSKGRFMWREETADRGNEPIVVAGQIIGMSKSRFNNRDFGVMAVDTAFTDLS